MATPPRTALAYVSPAILAGRIIARARAGERISKPVLRSAERIAAMSPGVAYALEREEAPYRVARWVAWADDGQQQQRRADLAVLLRRARPSKGWPDVGALKVAFGVYLQARPGGHGQVSDVAVERYLAAIDALPKRARRRRGEDESDAPALVTENVLRALVEARPSKPRRPPVLKLRTTPLRTSHDPPPTAQLVAEVDRVLKLQADNLRLRDQLRAKEQDALLRKAEHRRELAELTTKVEALERERSERSERSEHSSGTSPWLLALSAATGAMATEVVRRGAGLLAAGAPASAAGSLDGEALLGRLFAVFDDLARAQHHAEQGAPAAAIAEGLRIVRGQLDEALTRSGVERVPTVGQVFDPGVHAAVEHVEAPEPAGTVLREVLPGYTTGGRLLRAASVVVSKGPLQMLLRGSR